MIFYKAETPGPRLQIWRFQFRHLNLVPSLVLRLKTSVLRSFGPETTLASNFQGLDSITCLICKPAWYRNIHQSGKLKHGLRIKQLFSAFFHLVNCLFCFIISQTLTLIMIWGALNTFFLVHEILHCPSYDCMQRVLFAKANLANPGNFLHLWQCTQRGGYDIHSHTHQLRGAEEGCSSGEPYTVLLTQKRPSFFVVVSYEAAFTASSSPLPPFYAVAFFPPSCISQQTQSSGFLDCFCFILVYVRYLQSSETQMSAKMIHNWVSLGCIALESIVYMKF